ncbi:25120_t:CDS:2, partial [Gigaspora rosea]
DQNIIDGLISLIARDYDWTSEMHKTGLLDLDSENTQISGLTLVSATLTIITRVSVPFLKTFNSLLSLIKSLIQYLNSESSSSTMPYLKQPLIHGFPFVLAQNLLGQAIATITNLCKSSSVNNGIDRLIDIWNIIVDDILVVYCTNEVILRSIAEYMGYMRTSEDTSKNEQEPCEIFAMAYKVEEIETSIEAYRNKTMMLRRINTLISTKRIPEFYSEVTPLFCF